MTVRGRIHRAVCGDEGSATILSAWVIALILATAVGALAVIRAETVAHRVRSAADLAALAGAHALRAGQDACAESRRIAEANTATVQRCRTDGDDVIVTTSMGVEIGGLGVYRGSATARAGPG